MAIYSTRLDLTLSAILTCVGLFALSSLADGSVEGLGVLCSSTVKSCDYADIRYSENSQQVSC